MIPYYGRRFQNQLHPSGLRPGNCGGKLKQAQKVKQYHKLSLQSLLSLGQELRHPNFPEAITGLKGLEEADKILKEKNISGILVGVMLKELCKEDNINTNRFDKHKDIDVMVLAKNDIKTFEGGVDRWIPKTERLRIKYNTGFTEGDKTRWENGNGAKLYFGITNYQEMDNQPGLLIPELRFYRSMKINEAVNMVSKDVEIPEETIKGLEDVLLIGLQYGTNKNIRNKYGITDISSKNLYFHDAETMNALGRNELINITTEASNTLLEIMRKNGIEKNDEIVGKKKLLIQ